MQSPPGEGTRQAALRWLAHLRVADIPRTRTLFTHHPRYADLTPSQYADGLAWLKGKGLITDSGRPTVDIGEDTPPGDSAAVPRVLRDRATDEARAEIGAAGEQALLALLRHGGLDSVEHVSVISDAFGYDVGAVTPNAEKVHLEVKATTDPTRLVVHLTRHECEVMKADPAWIMGAVLVGSDGNALSVATVSRLWLRSAIPQDRSPDGRWESVRLAVPPQSLAPGLITERGKSVLPDGSVPNRQVWGMEGRVSAPV